MYTPPDPSRTSLPDCPSKRCLAQYLLLGAFVCTSSSTLFGTGYPEIAKLRRQLAHFETLHRHVHRDADGRKIVGYGYLLDQPDARYRIAGICADFDNIVRGTAELSEKQAECLSTLEIAEGILACRRAAIDFDQLSDVRQRALLHVCISVGPARFLELHRLHMAVKHRQFAVAARAMKQLPWFRRYPDRGKTIIKMVESGIDPPWLSGRTEWQGGRSPTVSVHHNQN